MGINEITKHFNGVVSIEKHTTNEGKECVRVVTKNVCIDFDKLRTIKYATGATNIEVLQAHDSKFGLIYELYM